MALKLSSKPMRQVVSSKWCRSFASSPLKGSIAAKPFYTSLEDRSIIKVSGPDALPFLQGLCTNNLNDLEAGSPSKTTQYTAFLAPKGRILSEAIVHRVEDDTFLIDCASDCLSPLGKHLIQYKVRRNATVKNCKDDYGIAVVLGGNSATLPSAPISGHVIASEDPRWSGLGRRMVFSKSEEPVWDTESLHSMGYASKTNHDYNKFCARVGVAQGSELSSLIPLQTNLEMMNGVSFSKGCYLGQELVARSHFKGTIRKRILPVQICDLAETAEDDVHVKFPTPVMLDSRKIGKLLGVHGEFGVALLSLEHFISEDGQFEDSVNERELHTDTHKIVVKGLPPYWDSSLVQ